MRTEDLLEAIGGADDELLERSEKAIHKKNYSWKRWIPLAACACIVIGVGIVELGNGFFATKDESAADEITVETEEAENSYGYQGEYAGETIGSSEEDTGVKVNYEGTIFPMTTSAESSQLDVTRDIVYDFSSSTLGKIEFTIEDSYVVTNLTEEKIELHVLYPYEVEEGEAQPVLADESGVELETVVCEAEAELETDVYETKMGNSAESVLETYLTIQAGESITVKATQYKDSDYYVELGEQFEYRLVTGLGDNLELTETTITIIDSEFVEVEIQDFGFDLIEGNRTGKLEIGKDYYIQVKMLKNN